MKKKYILNFDTETANGIMTDNKLDLSQSLVYDIGWAIIDLRGNTYEEKSYIVKEIFYDCKDLMTSAYYADKLPQYYEDIKNGKRKVASIYDIKADFIKTLERYNTSIVSAHNTAFDKNALTNTIRYITKSKIRYFFPFNTEYWDTMYMAKDTICKMKSYKEFCEKQGNMTKHKPPRVRATAESLYQFISGNHNFIESHTGLEDVNIEKEILWACINKKQKMRRRLYQ